jgi:hypothetical protein
VPSTEAYTIPQMARWIAFRLRARGPRRMFHPSRWLQRRSDRSYAQATPRIGQRTCGPARVDAHAVNAARTSSKQRIVYAVRAAPLAHLRQSDARHRIGHAHLLRSGDKVRVGALHAVAGSHPYLMPEVRSATRHAKTPPLSTRFARRSRLPSRCRPRIGSCPFDLR